MADRCAYTNPGISSINHPDRPIAAPWRCVRDADHEGGHAPVQACPEVALRDRGYDWPCVNAVGHTGDHRPPTEAGHVNRPLREMGREGLIQAAALAFSAAESANRHAREINGHLDRWNRQVANIAAHVLDGVKSPHGNDHTADCWTKHPHCLASAIIGCGGLDWALEHLAAGRKAGTDQAEDEGP